MLVNRELENEFAWSSDPVTYSLFHHLLFMANFKDTRWRDIVVQRGQVVAGRKSLSSVVGVSEQAIRTALGKLQSTNYIAQKSTKQYTIITICNYDSWVLADESEQPTINQQSTNEQPTTNQRTTNEQPTINHIRNK